MSASLWMVGPASAEVDAVDRPAAEGPGDEEMTPGLQRVHEPLGVVGGEAGVIGDLATDNHGAIGARCRSAKIDGVQNQQGVGGKVLSALHRADGRRYSGPPPLVGGGR